eukprot:COSAG02_NODE_6557_length_3497_cov_3.085344_5_plen_83_part_00
MRLQQCPDRVPVMFLAHLRQGGSLLAARTVWVSEYANGHYWYYAGAPRRWRPWARNSVQPKDMATMVSQALPLPRLRHNKLA